MISGSLREGVDVHFITLTHQHITLTILNSCPRKTMGSQTVSESSTHFRAKPRENNLTKSHSRRRINIPFYHTKNSGSGTLSILSRSKQTMARRRSKACRRAGPLPGTTHQTPRTERCQGTFALLAVPQCSHSFSFFTSNNPLKTY